MIFTEAAAERAKELIKEQGENETSHLRIYVEGGGCHGFSYGFTIATEIENDDTVIETNDVKLVIDSASIMYLDDAKVDFITSMHGDRFTIDNPNASTTCGCGSSFSI